MRLRVFCAILFCILLSPSQAQSVEIGEVISTSPSWNTFTNEDGTGLYHEILREVFALHGVPVRHIYSKSSRSEELVLQYKADFMVCKDIEYAPLALAKYPMYINDFYVFFKKERIGEWNGKESLRGKEVLSQPTYYTPDNFSVPVTVKEVMTGAQGLSMIIMDRSDFYVDDMTLIKQSIEENTTPYDSDDFEIKKIGRRSYHPLFNTTERGKQIMKMYDDGILQLHKSGKLKTIYKKWGHNYPDFDEY